MQLQVDTKEVKSAKNKLNAAIKKYDENSSNIFHEINRVKDYWIGTDANHFMSNIDSDKKASNDIITYLNELDSICDKIVSSYDNFK